MTTASSQQITVLLRAWSEGDQAALQALTPLVHRELHRLAHRQLGRQASGTSLQTSELVNEAWLRLVDVQQVNWQDRAHFFAVSAQLMRYILVDYARARQAHKRGGEVRRVSLGQALEVAPERSADLVALDDALKTLAALDPRQAQVVELRFFGGLSLEETGAVLKVSTGTVRRDWQLARVWLHRELSR